MTLSLNNTIYGVSSKSRKYEKERETFLEGLFSSIHSWEVKAKDIAHLYIQKYINNWTLDIQIADQRLGRIGF